MVCWVLCAQLLLQLLKLPMQFAWNLNIISSCAHPAVTCSVSGSCLWFMRSWRGSGGAVVDVISAGYAQCKLRSRLEIPQVLFLHFRSWARLLSCPSVLRQVYWPRQCRKLFAGSAGAVLGQGSRARRGACTCNGPHIAENRLDLVVDVPVICRRWGSSCALRQFSCRVFSPLCQGCLGLLCQTQERDVAESPGVGLPASRLLYTCRQACCMAGISLVWTDTCALKRVQNNNNNNNTIW